MVRWISGYCYTDSSDWHTYPDMHSDPGDGYTDPGDGHTDRSDTYTIPVDRFLDPGDGYTDSSYVYIHPSDRHTYLDEGSWIDLQIDDVLNTLTPVYSHKKRKTK